MSKVDWSKAPDGAEFYWDGDFYLEDSENVIYVWFCDAWGKVPTLTLKALKSYPSYEEKPRDSVVIGDFKDKFSVQTDLESDIGELIEKYDGKMSLAQFIGVLEIVKHDLLLGHSD